MKKQPPILVTGAHRSGTTWAGKMLASTGRLLYVHEPFNLNNRMGVNHIAFEQWYTCLTAENGGNYEPLFDNIMNLRYPLRQNMARASGARDWLKLAYDQSRFLYGAATRQRVLIKDPLAFFSSEWLCEQYNMDVLVMVRHPAAFCSSLIDAGWQFNFRHFLEQPVLLRKYLAWYEQEIRQFSENERPLHEQAALLWKCIYHTADQLRQTRPGWLFVRHEDLSHDPVDVFRMIFNRFGLPYTEKTVRQIQATSTGGNTGRQELTHGIYRNSRVVTQQWKGRLNPEQVAGIRERTGGVWELFYDNNTW